MKTAPSNLALLSFGGSIAVAALLAGCSGEPSDAVFAKLDAWIPGASVRALPLLAEDPPRWYQGTQARANFSGGQARATLIDGPTNSRRRFAWPLASSTVTQELLVKSADGRFYTTSYTWTADSIVDDCTSTPELCARYVDTYALSVDEAKSKLAGARQFSPTLYKQFFGIDAPLPKAGA